MASTRTLAEIDASCVICQAAIDAIIERRIQSTTMSHSTQLFIDLDKLERRLVGLKAERREAELKLSGRGAIAIAHPVTRRRRR